jgi:hypothetical protein
MANVFSLQIKYLFAQLMPISTVLHAYVIQDFMKFLDLIVKDAQMVKFGMELNAHGILHAQVGTFGILNIIDVMPKQFLALKMLIGMVLYAFVQQVIIYLETIVLCVHQILLGMEVLAILKLLLINVEVIKFLLMGDVYVKTDSLILKGLV